MQEQSAGAARTISMPGRGGQGDGALSTRMGVIDTVKAAHASIAHSAGWLVARALKCESTHASHTHRFGGRSVLQSILPGGYSVLCCMLALS